MVFSNSLQNNNLKMPVVRERSQTVRDDSDLDEFQRDHELIEKLGCFLYANPRRIRAAGGVVSGKSGYFTEVISS